MASAAPGPGPGPFGVTAKALLGEKVASGTSDLVSLSRQILKGSRSAELLGQAARNMAAQEDALLRSEDNMKKMQIITSHLQYQQESIQKNVEISSNVLDQLNHLLK